MRRDHYVVVVIVFVLLRWSQSGGAVQNAPGSSNARRYEKTFSLGAEPILMLENSSLLGTVQLQAGNTSEIRVVAEILSPKTDIDASVDNRALTIKLRQKPPISAEAVHFTVTVPPACEIEVSSMSGGITVRGVCSRLKVRTVDGNINLYDVCGQLVDARSSAKGQVTVSGSIRQGRYNIFSLGGSIDVTFTEPTSFILDAATHGGRIEMNGFHLKNEKRSTYHLEGTYGDGQAILSLSTHEGHIRLRKQ